MDEQQLREEICEVGRRMYENGFVAANGGNISARLGEDVYLVTPTGVSKKDLTPEGLLIVDGRCEVIESDGSGRPSSESKVHMYCYENRPDVMSVCHSHAPYSVAMASLPIKMDKYFLPEAVFSLGAVPRCEYAPAGSHEVAESMAPYIEKHSALLLGNHGPVTMGNSVMQAYFRMETLEHVAHVYFITTLLGGPIEFTPEQAKVIFDRIEASGRIHPGNIKL
jgi:L-fuculose-phosphate aldolase